MSPGLCLVLVPIGLLAGVLSMDSSSAVVRPLFCVGVCFPGAGAWLCKARLHLQLRSQICTECFNSSGPSDLALAFNIFEDPRVSNSLMKIQAYSILILHMIPMLLLASPQAVAQNLAFNSLGFFAVLDPLLDGAEMLEQVFGTFTILGLARSCMGNVHPTHAICVGVLSNMIEGIVVRILLRTRDAGLRVPAQQGRLARVGDEKFLTGASPYALQQVLELTRCREGRVALRHALHTLRRRLDRREQAVAQFLFVHHCAAAERQSRICSLFVFFWQGLLKAGFSLVCSGFSMLRKVQHKMGSAPLARILDFAAEPNEGSAEPFLRDFGRAVSEIASHTEIAERSSSMSTLGRISSLTRRFIDSL